MFTDSRRALWWAFKRKARLIIKDPGINRMYAKQTGGMGNDILTGLSMEEAHRQAVNILGVVDSLAAVNPTYDEILYAVYGYEYQPPRVVNLVRTCQLSVADYGHEPGILRLIQAYCGKRTSLREMRQVLQTDMNTVRGYKDTIYRTLDLVHDKAMRNIDDILKEKGIVESNNHTQGVEP